MMRKNHICVGCGSTFSKKEAEQRGFESWLKNKAGRDARSVAAGITRQKILGTSEMLP